LHIAAGMGDVVIIDCLYAHKANPDLLDHLDRTPLQIAAVKGNRNDDVLVLKRVFCVTRNLLFVKCAWVMKGEW